MDLIHRGVKRAEQGKLDEFEMIGVRE
jgi:hypothetical protein